MLAQILFTHEIKKKIIKLFKNTKQRNIRGEINWKNSPFESNDL